MAAVSDAELGVLRLRLEAVNLNGLATAVNALLGERPAAVCKVLASWNLAQSGELPRLVDGCWAALGPLGLGMPPGPGPETLEGVLAGRYADVQVVLDALEDCFDRADRIPVCAARSPASHAPDGELWHRALISALDDFWARMTATCARARPVLLRRDRAEAVRFLKLERVRLAEIAERIEALANCVVSTDLKWLDSPEPIGSVPRVLAEVPDPTSGIGGVPPDPTSGIGGVPPDPTSGIGGVPPDPLTPSGWLARLAQVPAQTSGFSTMSAEDIQRWVPVVFLAVVTGLAIVVLVTVAFGSPPS